MGDSLWRVSMHVGVRRVDGGTYADMYGCVRGVEGYGGILT